jgi:hypothetical protein
MSTHADPPVKRVCVCEMEGGSCQAAVASDLASLTSGGPVSASLAAVADTLARTLDAGAGLATAAVARELRATLLALAGSGGGDDDGTQGLLAELSAPVLDAPGPVPADVRPKGRADRRLTGQAAHAVATGRSGHRAGG